ncbi:MAG: TetR/AcrR family transcriptional regulator [Solimonas sp.]
MAIDATPSPRPGPRPSTSRQEIVQCAIRMLDREGPESLTFRAMARELGITVGALSRYFRNLADLQDAVAAGIMSDLRPIHAAGKAELRRQLVRLGTDLLEIHRAHPYLLKIQGPATAAAVARHTGQSLKALLEAGIEFERAMAVYALVASLPYAWGAESLRPTDPDLQASITQTYTEQLGEFALQIAKLSAFTASTIHRRWLQLYVDALLPG